MNLPHRQIKRFLPFWTVWFPLSLGILVVLVLFALIIFPTSTGNSQISMWSQIATILLVILMMVVGLFLLFFLIFGVVGVQKLANRLPGWSEKVNSFSVVNLARIQHVLIVTGKIAIFSETLLEQIKSAMKFLESKLAHKTD